MSNDFVVITSNIRKNSCHYQLINLMGYNLSSFELSDLNASIAMNHIVGRIMWPTVLSLDLETRKLIDSMEEKISQNNKDYKYYPTHYEYALLSEQVYKDHSESTEVMDGQWKVVKTYKNDNNGFYAALYKHKKYCQVVLAYRGSETNIYDFVGGDWKEDLSTIFLNRIEGQAIDAYDAMLRSVEIAISENCVLSFTGHSLGGWLANINSYLADIEKKISSPKSVTFDSPGIWQFVDRTKSNVMNQRTYYDPKYLDITNYASYPNLVNSVHRHIGSVNLVFTDIDQTHDVEIIKKLEEIRKLFSKITNGWVELPQAKKYFNLIYTAFGHPLSKIIAQFNNTTGYPSKGCSALNWPSIANDNEGFYRDYVKEYVAESCKSIVGLGYISNPICKFVSNSVTGYEINVGTNKIRISETAPYMVVNLLIGMKEGDIKYKDFFEQYVTTTENIFELGLNRSCQYHEDLPSYDRMKMLYQGKFNLEKLDPRMMLVNPWGKGFFADKFLRKIRHDSGFIDQPFFHERVQEAVRECAKLYNIGGDELNELVVIDLDTAEYVKQYANGIIKLYPELKEKLDNPNPLNTDSNFLKIEPKFYYGKSGNDYFLDREREYSLQSIYATIEANNITVLSSVPGVGKTHLADKLSILWYRKNLDQIPYWINANSSIMFHTELIRLGKVHVTPRIDYLSEIQNIVRKLANNREKVLFIFDNYWEDGLYEFTSNQIPNELDNSFVYPSSYQEHFKQLIVGLGRLENVRILITTRNNITIFDDLVNNIKTINLEVFNDIELYRYFRNYKSSITKDELDLISKHFGHLPLVLSQVARYLTSHLRKNVNDLVAEIQKDLCSNTLLPQELLLVAAVFKQEEKDLLKYLAYLGGNNFPIDILGQMTDISFDISRLEKGLSLISVDESGENVHVHEEVARLAVRYAKCKNEENAVIAKIATFFQHKIEEEFLIDRTLGCGQFQETQIIDDQYVRIIGEFCNKVFEVISNVSLIPSPCNNNILQNFIAEKHYGQGNLKEAIIWYKRSAENNNVLALHKLGMLYEKRSINDGQYKAADLFKKSAQIGFAECILAKYSKYSM